MYPGEEVDIQQFVNIMKENLEHEEASETAKALVKNENFIEHIVDLFNRANKTNAPTIKFQDLTNYLIQHEIEHYSMNAQQDDLMYHECPDIVDRSKHNQYIEKIYYFSSSKIDKVVLFETKSDKIKVYDAATMMQQEDSTINCPEVVNCIEFMPDRNAIAISLSDTTIRFYELQQ